MHDAGTIPQQHVCTRLLLDVAAEVAVGRPEDLLALRLQVFDDRQRAPVRDSGERVVDRRLRARPRRCC